MIRSAMPYPCQVKEFIDCISGPSSLYGLRQETLDSLVLMLLPPLTHKYDSLGEPSVMDSGLDLKVLLMQELLQNLRHCAGFCIPPVSSAMPAPPPPLPRE